MPSSVDCDADDARFGIMNVGALEDATLDGLRIDFSVVTGQHQHLRAVGEEFGRAAFVAFDVRGLVAQDAVVRLAHGGEGEGVGGGAIENEEDLTLRFEDVADEIRGHGGPFVVAIAADVAVVGFGDGGPCFGADAGVVVAGELATAAGGLTLRVRLMREVKEFAG